MSDHDARLNAKQLAQARQIARGSEIRDVERLVREYGGTRRRWRKLSSSPFYDPPNGWLELHWYEHHGVGRFQIKEVRVSKG